MVNIIVYKEYSLLRHFEKYVFNKNVLKIAMLNTQKQTDLCRKLFKNYCIT